MDFRKGWVWNEVMGYLKGRILNLLGEEQKVMDGFGNYAHTSKAYPSVLIPTWTRYV